MTLRRIKIILNIFFVSLLVLLVLFLLHGALESQVLFAQTASSSIVFTLTVSQQISISSPPNVTASTAIGLAQNTAVGTSTWNVKTNDGAGYTMSVKATSSPALKGVTYSDIQDYQKGAPNLWSATSGNAYFGYSAFGNDTPTGTWGTGSICSNTGANDISTTLKYQGFATTSGTNVASRTATTTGAGTDTNVCFAVEQKSFFIAADTYRATIIATATGN